jgi:hypothetical protein
MEMKTFGFGTKINIIETKRSIQIENILKEKRYGWFWEKFRYWNETKWLNNVFDDKNIFKSSFFSERKG